jgi:hypothetical protein
MTTYQEAHMEYLEREIRLLEKEVQQLRKLLRKAYGLAGGHIDGCLRGMMCNCGYMHWDAKLQAEEIESKRNQ